jgi:hypothetical protein
MGFNPAAPAAGFFVTGAELVAGRLVIAGLVPAISIGGHSAPTIEMAGT